MGSGFTVSYGPDGVVYAYPRGNTSVQPSAKMPANGLYFDNIVRQEDLSSREFSARKDYADQYTVFSEEDCRYYEEASKTLYQETNCAIFGNFFLGGLDDIFHIPGPWLEHPKGIRDPQPWIIAYYDHPDYVKEFFDMQTEITLKNLELYYQTVDDRIEAIAISGTDFGTQEALFISPDCYREFYKPYHKKLNDWVHKHTNWKVFFHTCGSIVNILDDLVEVGVDILNPVQFTAAGMDLKFLKSKYGNKIVFWGGGIDPQKTLPFGTPRQVEQETKRNVNILSAGGGFICVGVHNIQGPTPVENILAFFKAINNS